THTYSESFFTNKQNQNFSAQYSVIYQLYWNKFLFLKQGTGNCQMLQIKYAELLAIVEDCGEDLRPTYAGPMTCLTGTERNARS
ncbi:hypothetical protein FD755_015705, partial [Muntiacus reevesi]